MKQFPIQIDGAEWQVSYRPLSKMPSLDGEKCMGFCDFDKRQITVQTKLDPIEELLTLLHEHDHANHPNFDEEAVARIDDERAAIIKAAGLEITRRAK